ncbi:MAG: hypothetical protein GXO26_08335 [Crenarchaeota archaeon]|nr:hypothetical protein [Thermoproteota archaeon]
MDLWKDLTILFIFVIALFTIYVLICAFTYVAPPPVRYMNPRVVGITYAVALENSTYICIIIHSNNMLNISGIGCDNTVTNISLNGYNIHYCDLIVKQCRRVYIIVHGYRIAIPVKHVNGPVT